MDQRCCDNCWWYKWYWDWCERWKCEMDGRSICGEWKNRKNDLRNLIAVEIEKIWNI